MDNIQTVILDKNSVGEIIHCRYLKSRNIYNIFNVNPRGEVTVLKYMDYLPLDKCKEYTYFDDQENNIMIIQWEFNWKNPIDCDPKGSIYG